MSRLIFILALVLAFPTVARAADDDFATLAVRVQAIKGRTGEIGIVLFENKKGYPTHIEHAYEPVWIVLNDLPAGTATVEHVFEGLPAGDYAVSVVHDDNGNRKVDRSLIGFPKEGVGFSNDQKVKLSAPDYDDCKFDLHEGEQKNIVVTLDYRD